MRTPRIVHLSFAVVLLAALLPLAATAQPAAPIEPELLSKLQTEGSAGFFAKMAVEADLGAAYGMDWDARGEYVWNRLSEVARASQAPVLEYCHKHGLDCTSQLTTNSVFVRAGTLDAAQDLATLPGVAYLRLERKFPLTDPLAISGAAEQSLGTLGDSLNGEASVLSTTPWGIVDTNANDVWALGFKGVGLKVADIGTGVQWDHPALDQAFACGSPSDPECWHDPSDICGGSACDDSGLSTHVMGIMVGDDDPSLTYSAGMAPDAKWIACKGCESNSCSEFELNACADWILAPGGHFANRPHIVNNSWSGVACDNWYQASVQAWRAAGILPTFPAGSGGPGCATIRSPGDYQESMASAAYDSGRTIASFSARGPSCWGHDPFTKPNISAPGVSICSSVPTNAWSCSHSGTGMASAHTAGAVALVWQACPIYKGNIDGTFRLLQSSADAPPAGNCGAPPDGEGNYTYGYGHLNVLNAVNHCLATGGPWTYYDDTLCFDLNRFDGEYYPGNGKVYFLGGRGGADGTTTLPDIYSFDPLTRACADTGADMPVGISNYTIVPLIVGKAAVLCTFGGFDSAGTMIRDVQCYNPVTNEVTSMGQIPKGFDTFLVGGAAAVNNKAYIFGGWRTTASPYTTDLTYEWDPSTNVWTEKDNLSLGRAYVMSAVVDGKIYAFGGLVWDGATAVPQRVAERFDPRTGTWSDIAVADLPLASGEGRAYGFDTTSRYSLKGQVAIAGGGQWPSQTAEGMVYDVASNSYDTSFPDLNVARRDHAGFFVPGMMARLWVVGGRSRDPGYGGDSPPYAPAEYLDLLNRIYLPLLLRSWPP